MRRPERGVRCGAMTVSKWENTQSRVETLNLDAKRRLECQMKWSLSY